MHSAFALLFLWLQAQPVDPTTTKINPKTFLFEDGKTTFNDYVLYMLQNYSQCCGEENIYVEIYLSPEGQTQSVRAIMGENECYKKSLVDIISPLQWSVEGITARRPVYYEVKLQKKCTGDPQENQYTPIPAPKPKVAMAPPEPKPAEKITPTPPIPGQLQPQEPAPKEETAAPKKEETEEPIPPKPKITQKEKTLPTQKTSPPQKTPPPPQKTTPPPMPEDTSKGPRLIKITPPKKYQSTGEKNPDRSHISSYVNTSGPRYTAPEYINGPIAQAIFLKSELRKKGICGLAHLLVELEIERDGSIRGYRILKANSNALQKAATDIILQMKYKPVPIRTITYFEFKADVDCQSDAPKLKLDSIPDFLVTPEGKLIQAKPAN
ncbi:MAG: hypothetical protein ACUVRD_05630 [Bacteroidia bacterium]